MTRFFLILRLQLLHQEYYTKLKTGVLSLKYFIRKILEKLLVELFCLQKYKLLMYEDEHYFANKSQTKSKLLYFLSKIDLVPTNIHG